MRVISLLCYALAGLLGAAAIAFNLYAQSLACAFGNAGGRCRLRWPWQMAAEDVQIFVLIPLIGVGVLVLLGWLAGRAGRRQG
ncbi:MAG: methionine synthase [Rhodobacter sp.]|uniref:methionine synthase n=1 Tax=Pararhodobacter sp. TaxID=2127056 RepID=UPI001DD4ADE5|nr:methionine synthase [Pararhodobacter sp.]MCB1343708.1 methionine synthase [Paracoccaceae bacterium]MCC0072498.1 methionine synthase [Rhodobacter sp.]HPD92643.1 methionine synthase [Pararhodobacter sp.]